MLADVAVTGLPEPQFNHAVIMSRFAGSCLERLGIVLKELEVSLGPDTADLGMVSAEASARSASSLIFPLSLTFDMRFL